jgi:CHAD domain-containing protein
VAQALGAVRDADVQLGQVRAWTAEAAGPDREALGELTSILEGEREKARSALLAVLDSRRYDRLTTAFGSMLRHGPLRSSPASRAPVLGVAPGLITTRYRRVLAAARRAARTGTIEDHHRLRIRCKRLRYALEFFDDVYEHRGRTVTRRLAKLQDLLGGIQDAHVAVVRLRDLATAEGSSLSPATIFAMGQVAERHAHQAAELRRRFPKSYRRFRGRSWRTFARILKERSTPADLAVVPPTPTVPAAPAAPKGRG